METAWPAHADHGGFMRTVSRIVRFRRRGTKSWKSAASGVVTGGDGTARGRFPEYFDDASTLPSEADFREEDEKKRRQQLLRDRETLESFLAKLFASVSAVKAAYARLQMAQSPYDPDTIQSADQVVVEELKQLSQLKQSYYKGQIHGGGSARDAQMLAEIQEQMNLIKAFQITAKKMETDLQHKDEELLLLREQLSESEKMNRWMEVKVHPDRSLQMVDNLRLSELNSTHFVAVLRYTVKSMRAFAKVMVGGMERAGWNLDAAAASIEGDACLRGKPERRGFVFEAFVCRSMLSDFQHPEFGLSGRDEKRRLPERRLFFEEFIELKLAKLEQLLDNHRAASNFRVFCRAKYLSLVHQRMERSFFGNLDHRALVGSGNGFPETEFFRGFAEMARRVWLLHRLFFSFAPDAQASIFQARKGCRFSEVFMESVADPDGISSEGVNPIVDFTVVPGFKVGKTVIQCKVYLQATLSTKR